LRPLHDGVRRGRGSSASKALVSAWRSADDLADKEAADIFSSLPPERREAVRLELAGATNNLAAAHSNLVSHAKLRPRPPARSSREDFAADGGVGYQPILASLYLTLAAASNDCGDLEGAIAAVEKAVCSAFSVARELGQHSLFVDGLSPSRSSPGVTARPR
jgi:hypothetical protein